MATITDYKATIAALRAEVDRLTALFTNYIDGMNSADEDSSLADIKAQIERLKLINGQGNPGSGIVPAAPTNLAAVLASSTQVNLTWTEVPAVSGYSVERCSSVGCSDFTFHSSASANFFNDNSASPSTAYSYQVKAINIAGSSVASNRVDVITAS